MSAAKFTPGPWHHGSNDGDPSSQSGAYVMHGGNEYLVAQTTNYFGWEARRANARLIAAAPELLALLQEVFVIGDRLVDDVYGHEFVANAKAAIAKATGAAA